MRPSLPGIRFTRLVQVGIAVVWCALLGCSGTSANRELEPQSVRGKILLNGKPVHKARVTLHPVTHAGKIETQSSKTNELGVFTFIPGVPVGDYKLTVVLTGKSDKSGAPANQLPARFENPESSGLTAHIVSGNNDIDPIELSK